VLECAGLEATRCSTDPGGSQDESRPEACNGLDDDCDGQTDEGAPVLDSCELGAEAADGLDNNCDGIIDPPGGCVRRHPFVAVYVDTYEAAVFENPDCTGRQYGIYSDDYPADWPDGAQAGTRSLYACSLPGLRPSRSVTWYQARRACLAQGKRLCTKQEWAQACGGSIYSKFPYGNVFNAFFCNTFSAGHLDTVAAGSMPNCRAEFGMFDMSGNLWEWVESVCQNDSAMKAIQGGSYYCWVYVSGQGWMPCDMDDPAHTQEIAWQHACQYPPHDRFYCELPLTAQVNFGFRCCLDAP
jgi:formylglycine-generating enzyme required for sulfatase activity